jgi:putative MFS transporter
MAAAAAAAGTGAVDKLLKLFAVPSLRAVTVRLWAMWLACTAAYYAVVLIAPTVAADTRAASAGATSVAPEESHAAASAAASASATSLVIQALAEYPAYVLQYVIGRSFGRRAGLSLCTVMTGLTGLAWALAHAAGRGEETAFVVFRMTLMVLFNLLWLVTPEAFPTSLRSTGCGSCSGVSRVAGAMAPFLLVLSGPALHVGALLAFGVCLGSSWTLPRETADRPLADYAEEDEADAAVELA